MRELRGAIDEYFKAALRSDIVWRTAIFLIAAAVLIVISSRWNRWESDAEWQSTDDAYLQSDLTPISAKVAGYIRALPVQDFERVRAGQLLAQIVDDDYRAAVAQINAGIAAAAAQVEAIKAQRSLQEANVRAAQATVNSIVANVEQQARNCRPGTRSSPRSWISPARNTVPRPASSMYSPHSKLRRKLRWLAKRPAWKSPSSTFPTRALSPRKTA